ncbi:MAG: glutamate 5-kinase [Proteobacteria bacterium]|nr:glutamate 5-kinase [Pseudomonadota bacterium]
MSDIFDISDSKSIRRIVIKIGSALLVNPESGRVRDDWLKALAAEVARLMARGQQVLIVSSGAVALGGQRLALDNPRSSLSRAQAAAAVGQIALAHAYEEAFAGQKLQVAQVLLTIGDLEDRQRYLNARATLETLFEFGAVALINENDTVATSEIRFGDNDRLAARVAQLAAADLLVLLSDIDGLYTSDPAKDPDAIHIPLVENITAEIEASAGPSANAGFGSGGMISKLAAARIATESGCNVIIADGREAAPITRYEKTGRGTLFLRHTSVPTARKAWLKTLQLAAGTLRVDAGAGLALKDGKSLLAAGISGAQGPFQRGDFVLVKTDSGETLGRGLVAYTSSECERIMGTRSGEHSALLGYPGRGPVIHRDNFVLDGSEAEKTREET